MNGFGSALSLMEGARGLLTSPAGYGIAVWVLAIVFVWSGLAKLRRPALAAMAITDFGVLRKIRPWLGTASWWGGVASGPFPDRRCVPIVFLPATAGLLWLFVLLIARSLWSGKEFSCFCFGGADARISRVTLLRTIALALLASRWPWPHYLTPALARAIYFRRFVRWR